MTLVVVATKVEKSLAKDLRAMAKANDRTVAAEVRLALRARIDEHQARPSKEAA